MSDKQPTLFDVPPSSPSKESRLRSFVRERGILTYRTPGMRREDEPWIAVLPFPEDEGKSFGELMANYCRVYEESGREATGTGELSAVRKLCEQMNIPCDL